MAEEFSSGFVALVGRPNVGKSTLINTLARQKIAIVSDKPQTTRHRIRAIVNRDGAQVIFMDTPGFHRPVDSLGRRLMEVVRRALREVDVVAFVVDASQSIGAGDCYIAGEIAALGVPVVVVVNKVDLTTPLELETQLEVVGRLGKFKAIVPISAKDGRNLEAFLDEVSSELPAGPRYYPEDVVTDQPETIIIGELIREKVLEYAREEVPYSVAVQVEDVSQRKGKDLIDISASLLVERSSQKGILIGQGGKRVKEVGSKARLDIERLLGSKVYLDLMVKVRSDWRRDDRTLKDLGYI